MALLPTVLDGLCAGYYFQMARVRTKSAGIKARIKTAENVAKRGKMQLCKFVRKPFRALAEKSAKHIFFCLRGAEIKRWDDTCNETISTCTPK
jgi:hypothetical protein